MVSALLPFAFSKDSAWFILSEKITWIYFFIALIISVNAILNTVGDELKKNKQLKNRPMKGFIQIFRVVFLLRRRDRYHFDPDQQIAAPT